MRSLSQIIRDNLRAVKVLPSHRGVGIQSGTQSGPGKETPDRHIDPATHDTYTNPRTGARVGIRKENNDA